MKVLITGGGGFIGHHLAKKLYQLGNEIFILENFSRGVSRRLDWFPDKEQIINIDVTNSQSVDALFESQNFDAVFHLAAINGTENFYKIPLDIMDVGVLGCMNILKSAKRTGVSKVIVASSAEVYQNAPVIPTPEDIPLIIPEVKNPRYSYALSKIFTEYYAYHYGIKHDMNVSIFRPHNIYGPDMGYKHVIPEIAMELNKFSTGGQALFKPKGPIDVTRSFCYITDLIDGLNLILEKNQGVGIYNIGNDHEIDIKSLILNIASILDKDVQIKDGGVTHEGTAKKRCPDISKIRKFGYEPKIDIFAGLKETVSWYQENDFLDEKNANVLA